MNTETNPTVSARRALVRWIKKIGFWGFLFFLFKGLLWLILPWLLARGIFS